MWEISVLDLQFCSELETALKMVINLKKNLLSISFYPQVELGYIIEPLLCVRHSYTQAPTPHKQTPCICAAKDPSSSQIIKSSLEELVNASWRGSQNHLTELEPFSWLPT